ncbi:MAG TPA: hypothetical protein VMM83_01655 [Longimicrobiales bacterium]|nr:hypothetical protein [Longimicrobiales bacterium]
MIIDMTRVLVIALGAATLAPAGLAGQTVSLSPAVDGVRDDIPATHLRWTVEGVAQPFSWLYLMLGGRSLTVEQEPAQGLGRFEESLESGFGEAAALVGNGALVFRTGLNRTADGDTDTEYLARGQYAFLSGSDPRAMTTTTFTVEAARAREVTVAMAIAERITYDRISGGLDVRTGEGVSVSARLNHARYSDDNRKTDGHAYGLVRVVNQPEVSFGYAYAFADTEIDHWRATGSTLVDPAAGVYEYHYFHYPYFTPVAERGHLGLAVFQWSSEGGSMLSASAHIPLYSRGQLRAVPRWGTTEEPPPPYGYYTATGILPLEARVGASLRVLSWLTARARYEFLRKPYYSYQAGGVSLQFTF